MGLSEIPAQLMTRLKAMSGVPPIAMPNEEYLPVPLTPYLKVYWLPAQPRVVTVGPGEIYLHRGIYQISVFVPAGEGDLRAGPLADQIVAWFKDFGAQLSNGYWLRVVQQWPARALDEDAWYQKPVNVEYQIYTT